MRIGLNTTDAQAASAEQAKKSAAVTTNQLESVAKVDQATLTHDNVTLSSLSAQAVGMPEVRQSLVESLKQSINSGQYTLDPSSIADAILNW